MDANGQRFWLWAGPRDFQPAAGARWDASRQALTLTSTRSLPALNEDRTAARLLADGAAGAVDEYGGWARVDGSRVLASGVDEGEMEIHSLAPGSQILDLALAGDGILYLCVEEGPETCLELVDTRGRFRPRTVTLAGFAPQRLAVGGPDTLYALDRAGRQLAQVRGRPLPELLSHPDGQPRRFDPEVFRPTEENPDPPRLVVLDRVRPAPGEMIALGAGGQDRALMLLWPATGPAQVQLADPDGVSPPLTLEGVIAPFTLGWLGDRRFAVATAGAREAVVFTLPEDPDPARWPERLSPDGGRWPLLGWRDGRFWPGSALPVSYPTQPDPALPPTPRPLHRLSAPGFAPQAMAAAATVDGGQAGFVWHRLYLEAALPPGTRLILWLSADDDPAGLDAVAPAPHVFQNGPPQNTADGRPQGVWLDQDSELPFHSGLGDCPRRRDHAGLFTCLIQGAGTGPSRQLAGRWLRLTVELAGDGRTTPQVFAVRAWGPRFSYRDRYLPALYQEVSGDQAAGVDFLDRFLALFESLLTPLEDQVAAAWRLTDPDSAPAEALDWLAGWVGAELEPGLSTARRRRLLREATALWRWRGTLTGLNRMLDVVTDDGVTRGELVVVEHFRLRRTFATILGADLAPQDDPLTLGTAVSGNSYLGSTFFLGKRERREFFALFRPELLEDPLTAPAEAAAGSQAVETLLDSFAHRLTVLVHGELSEDDLGLVRRVVERESPAHAQTRVLRSRRPLILGLTALLAVDSYLRPRPPRPGLALGGARLGQAFLQDAASLDPRLEGG